MALSRLYFPLICLLFIFSGCDRNEEAIRQQSKAYENAYNKKDAKALAALWAEDASYVNPLSNEEVTGRAAIEKVFQDTFPKGDQAKLQLKIDSISFPQPDEAIESGLATLKQGDKVISQEAYRAYYDKISGSWLITEIREVDFGGAPMQNENLKPLQWLIGVWIDEDDDSTILSDFSWDKYSNFLTEKFSVNVEGQFELEGKQIIGWDPIEKKIRSWVFDSDGAFGEGTWRSSGKGWNVDTVYTLSDGRRASAIYNYTPIDANNFSWSAFGREVDGEMLPDLGPVTILRKKG